MDEKRKEKIVEFFNQILKEYDFELVIDVNEDLEKAFRLNDIQKGNLGKIEQETFLTLADIINRLEIYHQDYVYVPLENRQSNKEKIPKDDWDLVTKRYLENETVGKTLSRINAKEYENLVSKKENFDIQDIIKILDEDEKFYKSVCEKYIETMSKEMLLEIDNKILHIFIEDEYIKLKEEGKINNQNYKEYLDGDFKVYEYDSYQELYNSVIKDEIAYDLNDLELFDENGNWDFYISFEELKKLGYGYIIKDHYPLIEQYAISNEDLDDFFNHFTLEQLDDFEETLGFYFIEGSIVYEEIEGLTTRPISTFRAKESYSFNSDILHLACGLISYKDFLEDYTEYPKQNEVKNENEIDYDFN